MFKAMFQNSSRYFMVYVANHDGQLFASIASMIRWLDRIGVSNTELIVVKG